MMLRGLTAQGGGKAGRGGEIAAARGTPDRATASTNGVGAHSSVTSVPEAKDEDTRNFLSPFLESWPGKSLGTCL